MRLRTLLTTATAALATAGCLTAAGPAAATARHACSPAVSIDSYSDALDKTTYGGRYAGNFSALAVDRDGALAALSDRSTLFRLDAHTLRPRGAHPLTGEDGGALDSEGLVVDRDGTRLVSSESEPAVRRYAPRPGPHAGPARLLERLPLPDGRLRPAPAGRARANGTFEGLTLLPGGRTLLAAMEYPLDGDDAGTVRFQTWRRGGAGEPFRAGAQYAYRVDAGLGVPEVAAVPGGRLLVLERGFTTGVGNTVRLYLADPRRAADVRAVGRLNGTEAMPKALLADLVTCPSLGAPARQPQPNPLLDNIEGMAVTGRGSGGALTVLLVSDDNQSDAQTTRFYRLRVRPEAAGAAPRS